MSWTYPEKPVLKSVASGNKFENHIRIALLDDLRPAYLTICGNPINFYDQKNQLNKIKL
jgi:hypothetical protein